MTRRDWPSIKRDYVETTMTLADIESKWVVPRGTLSARATREMWHSEKQQFAAKLEQKQREIVLAERASERAAFEKTVLTVARAQLGLIARHTRDGTSDIAKLLKLTTALERVMRVGSSMHGEPMPARNENVDSD